MNKHKNRIKAVCASIAKIYSLLNALQFKVLFLLTYKLCMYICISKMFVCSLHGLGGFLEGGKWGVGGCALKFQWNLICKQLALAAINFTQEISRCLVHIYTWGAFPKKWNLMAAVKWIRGLILMQGICISTLCESLLHGCIFCFLLPLFFWKESRLSTNKLH